MGIKVGDKVRVKDDISGYGLTVDGMKEYQGNICTISEEYTSEGKICYCFEEDKGSYAWSEDMFDLAKSEEPEISIYQKKSESEEKVVLERVELLPVIDKEVLLAAQSIMSHYGPLQQGRKLIEEVQELDEAFGSGDYSDILEEEADCFLVLLQFYFVDNNMRNTVAEKVKRTLERMEQE